MIKASISLQDLRRRIYLKSKKEESHKFWGMYVHVCKMDTLRKAYIMAKEKAGSSGIDRVTFEDIEEIGVTKYLKEIREELVNRTYKPQINRKQEIPKENGKVRVLGIPTIKDRIVQGALKLILEPIFEADFQEGSYGYRPKRNAHQAVKKIEKAIITGKRKVIDLDLSNYFDTVKHHILLAKVGKRVIDKDIMHLIKLILKASGKEGVPQGGVISPLFANLYLNEVDKMLERATEVTKSKGRYTEVEYARFADDIVIAVSSHYSMNWLLPKVMKRLKEEFNKIQVKINKEKTKIVNLEEGDSINFLGFTIKRRKTFSGKWGVLTTPQIKKRTKLLQKIREVVKKHRTTGIFESMIEELNSVLRGWINYFTIGDSRNCFSYIRDYVEKKVRRYLMKQRGKQGYGWERWSSDWLYNKVGLFNDYKVAHYQP
ncbi:Retron-type reverse transcriptase [Halobacteroides halobius DSM 5150]|uniref:Retron-type reverse transcriptase n=1 Tax=Halobacteroides halobius (strain ATCC 35273 / DSM 5150 / MD-1) TaxID=748449 RepID=L0KAM6_HALHC|nr:group II intron reverse transcriptase/maturase [Halobacteroides halobius]AGB41419.1 Retron-type reverse transcriptase [Halobacteroides halobius DSM 5150]AGB41428.1 Retron-type reverse transcriptase [Halobacteroides halobius DSM 5150]